jgi:nitrile hydratase accessory protein
MADTQSAVRRAIEIVSGIPCEREAPVFEEPWQAQVFAMALTLQQQGFFTWHEWAETLADEIKKALASGDPDDGSTYYFHWLATLERLVATKGIAPSATLQRYYHAWDRAADRTPHGTPIVLHPSDFPEGPSDLQSTI